VNRLAPSSVCRVCGMNLRRRLDRSDLVLMRMNFARMIANGMCDGCQFDRLEAAMEYENAAAEVRMVTALGAGWSRSKPPVIRPELAQARKRARAADAWCVRLKMWPDREERK
jgi:hypothetical protein